MIKISNHVEQNFFWLWFTGTEKTIIVKKNKEVILTEINNDRKLTFSIANYEYYDFKKVDQLITQRDIKHSK